jgi:hypothetical protein
MTILESLLQYGTKAMSSQILSTTAQSESQLSESIPVDPAQVLAITGSRERILRVNHPPQNRIF